MLTIESLSIGSGSFSHAFEAGKISVILGNNGAGKSTLTRLISGLAPVRAGKILLNGNDITQSSVRSRDIALVFQEFVNYPSLTCFENIASPLRAKKVSSEKIKEEVLSLARTLQLSEFLDRFPDALSGGQQQRLAIARALAKGAQVLLLDEPLVNLDYKLRESLVVELKQLLHKRNCIVIYTSSDTSEAFAVADELILFEQGCLIQSGTPMQLMLEPHTLACADLMADPGINSLRGTLRDGRLNIGGADARTYAVRPDHLHLSEPPNTHIQFNGRSMFSESNGSDTYLHIALSTQDTNTAEPITWVAHLPGHHDFIPDTPIEMYISAQDLKVF